jgi:glucan endo-1,3-alpha-glucosidase
VGRIDAERITTNHPNQVGNTGSYDVNDWTNEIKTAAEAGIDGFALNIGTPLSGNTETQIENAFKAVNGQSFKLFFSFDYEGGTDGPWSASDVAKVLKKYASNKAHYKVDGAALASTFEGPDNAQDWAEGGTIRSAVPGGIHFIPDWTSLGPDGISAKSKDIDGACKLATKYVQGQLADVSQSIGICGQMDQKISQLTLINPGNRN